MNRYKFNEGSETAQVIQHWRSGKTTTQNFALHLAIEYARSHGKRQDLSESVWRTEVVYKGDVVYVIEAVERS